MKVWPAAATPAATARASPAPRSSPALLPSCRGLRGRARWWGLAETICPFLCGCQKDKCGELCVMTGWRSIPDPSVADPRAFPPKLVSVFWSAIRSWNLPDVVPFSFSCGGVCFSTEPVSHQPSVLANQSHPAWSNRSVVPLGVATPGICVSVPPCAAYRSPIFFTPGVSKTLLLLTISQMQSNALGTQLPLTQRDSRLVVFEGRSRQRLRDRQRWLGFEE